MAVSSQHRTAGPSRTAVRVRSVKAAAQAARARAQAEHLPPKLVAPRAVRLYPRTRLFDLLDRMREEHRVIWVSAPAGAGKTSLATSYLGARKLPLLWYQVDQGDGDVASFFYYLGLAARRAAPRHKAPLPRLTPEYLADVPAFARHFFRELYRRLPRNGAIVLDNYQDAPEDSLLHEIVRIAIQEVPQAINLLVLSRAEPPAALARLRVGEDAACLDAETIQLTREEIAGIAALRTGQTPLQRAGIETLHERTRGWAAGVALMLEQSSSGVKLNSSELPSDQKLLFDYFATEIFDRLEPGTRDVLLAAAFLPKMSAAMLERLTGHGHAARVLVEFSRKRYFTVMIGSSAEPMFEFHPLFREFLLARAHASYARERLAPLQRDAVAELEANGQIEAAAELLQLAGEWAGLVRLIEHHAAKMLAAGRGQTVEGWIRSLPEQMLEQTPWLLYRLGECLIHRDAEESRRSFERAYAAFDTVDDAAGLYSACAGVIMATYAGWQDFTPIGRWIKVLDELRRRHTRWPSPEIEKRVTTAAFTGLMYYRPDHPDMPAWFAHACRLLDTLTDPVHYVRLGYRIVICLCWTGDLDQAQALLRRLQTSLKTLPGTTPSKTHWQLSSIIYHWHHASPRMALKLLDEGLAAAGSFTAHAWVFTLHNHAMLAAVIHGDLPVAQHCLQRMEATRPSRGHVTEAHYLNAVALVKLHLGEFAEAVVCAKEALALSRAAAMQYVVALASFAVAMTSWHVGERDTVLDHIREARAIGAGMRGRPFLYWSWLLEAHVRLEAGESEPGLAALRKAMELSREMKGCSIFYLRRPQLAGLYARALEHDIEPAHVQDMIRRLELAPPDHVPTPESWPYPVRIHTLGRFSVMIGDEPLRSSSSHNKPLELLKALVALGGRDVDENRLAEIFWPEAEGDSARQNLKINLHRLRKLLPEGAILWTEGRFSLDARRIWLDLWVLERELGRLDQRSAAEPAQDPAPLVHRLFNLYRGGFLAGDDHPWAIAVHERLRAKLLRIVTRALEPLRMSDPAAAIPIYERAIEVDPLREPLYQGLLRCHQILRQPAEGLRVYRRWRDILQRELGIAPSPATEALHQALKAAA